MARTVVGYVHLTYQHPCETCSSLRVVKTSWGAGLISMCGDFGFAWIFICLGRGEREGGREKGGLPADSQGDIHVPVLAGWEGHMPTIQNLDKCHDPVPHLDLIRNSHVKRIYTSHIDIGKCAMFHLQTKIVHSHFQLSFTEWCDSNLVYICGVVNLCYW